MRRLIFIMTAFFALLMFSLTAFAENGVNLLRDYSTLEWSGSPMEYNSEHKTLSFLPYELPEPEDHMTAYIEFPVGGASGFCFYADAGSYEGGSEGSVCVYFYDNDGQCLITFSPDADVPDGSFHRYRLGSEDGYIPVPENAAKVRVSLCRNKDHGAGPYFRNLSLMLSGDMPLSSESSTSWTVSGKLELVQVKVSKSQYWIWVAIIAAVPLMFFALRKARDKAGRIK